MTRIFDVIGGLLVTFRAADGFTAPGGSGIQVFDGVQEIGDEPITYVVVGALSLLADEDVDDVAASSDAEWRSVPVTVGSQTETVAVPCVVSVWTGDGNGRPDFASLRSEVAAIITDLEAATRTANGVGITGQITVTFTNFRLRQAFAQNGTFVSLEFVVEVKATK